MQLTLPLSCLALWVTGILAVSSPATASESCPPLVRVNFHDISIPPFINGTGSAFSDPPGYLVTWITRAIHKTGCDVQIDLRRRPIKRAMQELEYAEADILSSTTATPERLAQFAFPQHKGSLDTRMLYYQTDTSLWVRKGETAMKWDGHTLRGPDGFTVGAPLGTNAQTLVQKHEWKADIAPNAVSTMEKLLRGRTLAALLPDVTVASLPPEKRAQLERLQPSVERIYLYSPVSQTFYAAYPEFVKRYWSEFCKISRLESALPEQKLLPQCR